MPVRGHLPGESWLRVLRNAAVRTGIYIGVCFALVSTSWLLLANYVRFLERFALERNLAAVALFGLLVVVPVIRFIRQPSDLLVSSLIAWTIFSLTYRVFCMFFSLLGDKYSATHVFMLGAVVYLIATTLSWLGTFIWKVRETYTSHSNHHVS
jgi:hypothetical protein